MQVARRLPCDRTHPYRRELPRRRARPRDRLRTPPHHTSATPRAQGPPSSSTLRRSARTSSSTTPRCSIPNSRTRSASSTSRSRPSALRGRSSRRTSYPAGHRPSLEAPPHIRRAAALFRVVGRGSRPDAVCSSPGPSSPCRIFPDPISGATVDPSANPSDIRRTCETRTTRPRAWRPISVGGGSNGAIFAPLELPVTHCNGGIDGVRTTPWFEPSELTDAQRHVYRAADRRAAFEWTGASPIQKGAASTGRSTRCCSTPQSASGSRARCRASGSRPSISPRQRMEIAILCAAQSTRSSYEWDGARPARRRRRPHRHPARRDR